MKLTKMLGLAVVAALAAMAFVGVGNASAISLCKENTTPCTNAYTLPQAVEGTLQNGSTAVLKAGFAEVKCTVSTIKGNAERIENGQIAGKIESVTWENCTCAGAATGNAKPLQLPWRAHLQQKEPEEQGNGNFYVGPEPPSTGEQPGAEVPCKAFGVTCYYKVKEHQPKPGTTENEPGEWGKLQFTGNGPASITANQLELKKVAPSGALCAEKGLWSATYDVVKPNPVFLDS